MFKIGQEVYCAIYGKGIVKEFDSQLDLQYPMSVSFPIVGVVKYTRDGKYHISGKITLSLTPIPEIVNSFWEPKEGDLIYIEPYKGSTIYEDILRKVLKVDRVLLDSWNGPEVIVIYHKMEYRVLISHIRLAKPTDFSSYKLQDYQNFILDSFYSV